MFNLLALTALAFVKFPGGTPSEFATTLADAAKQNVLVVQSEPGLVDACEYEVGDLNELARAIRKQTKLFVSPGTDLILQDGLLPTEKVARNTSSASVVLQSGFNVKAIERPGALALEPIDLPALKDKKVTFETKKLERLNLRNLNNAFSMPLQIHNYYLESVVSGKVSDLAEMDFLKWLAKGIGARLLATPKEYRLELDAVEVRKRAIATIMTYPLSKQPGTADSEMRKRNFRIAAINALTPTQITSMLSEERGDTKIELNARNPITRLALNFVTEEEKVRQQAVIREQRQGQRTAAAVPTILEQYDSSKPVYLVVTSKFQTTIEIPLKGGGVTRF